MPERKTFATTVLACLVLALTLAVESYAQDRAGSADFGNLFSTGANPLEHIGGVASAAVTLEGPVNPDEYIVGPGDLFHVSIGGPQPIVATLPVSADGFLVLPGSGAASVAGRTLAEARRVAQSSLRQQFRNVVVEVALLQPRQFFVHVSGAVPVPGRYVATPVARLASVINMAFADTVHAPVTSIDFRPSLRNVRVIHRDGVEESVDVLRYFATGNPDHNPYLQDGDVISVPAYRPDYDAVFVSGSVAFPGTYDYRTDDTLYDVLVLATGHHPPTGIAGVRVTRTGPDGAVSAQVYDASDLGNEILLRPLDQVHVLADEIVRGTAEISGWVRFPGEYSIIPGQTTLDDLVVLAGGLKPGALEHGGRLHRATLPEPQLSSNQANRFEFAPRAPNPALAFDSLALHRSTRLASLDFHGRAYLAQELRLQSSVPVDLTSSRDSAPIFLEDGDRVHVPRDERTVFVFGQVNRPGYVAFTPGEDASHYISASGGASNDAGRSFVIEAGTGRYVDARDAEIESGDMIFIDRAENRAQTAEMQQLLMQERRDREEGRARIVQVALQGLGTAAAIITSYILLKRELQ